MLPFLSVFGFTATAFTLEGAAGTSLLCFADNGLRGMALRGMEIEGKFVKFTAIRVYLEEEAGPLLTVKWKGKNADELTDFVEFFRKIVIGIFIHFDLVESFFGLFVCFELA
ncbi:Chalcone--flavanone isomerase [Euphorbia peplus]|nr:Chalcone--flavanone isomerase [Euphorbia peplus]